MGFRQLGAEYPLEAPRIRLEDGRGLSQKDIADLQRQLEVLVEVFFLLLLPGFG